MFAIDQFVADCQQAIDRDEGPLAVRDIVAQAVASPNQIFNELGAPEAAGFHVLHHGSDLTILNFAWAPLMHLLPHDHNDIWAVIGIYEGREDNVFWRRTVNSIEATTADALSAGDTAMLGPQVIHSVLNPIPRMSLGLHVYAGDFFAEGRSEWDSETLAERPFDVEGSACRFHEASARFAGGQRNDCA